MGRGFRPQPLVIWHSKQKTLKEDEKKNKNRESEKCAVSL